MTERETLIEILNQIQSESNDPPNDRAERRVSEFIG